MQIHMILYLKVATVVILSIILATYRVSDALMYQKCQFISQLQEKKTNWDKIHNPKELFSWQRNKFDSRLVLMRWKWIRSASKNYSFQTKKNEIMKWKTYNARSNHY